VSAPAGQPTARPDVDDQQRTIRRRVGAARAGQDGALERLQENALGDLQYLLASLDAATLISRVEVALADAVRACARGNALEGAKILAGALTRAV
jgi:hypothetical protein